ncbi:MAG: ATP-binding cassette domain-containing protein [Desulfosarcina sp.]
MTVSQDHRAEVASVQDLTIAYGRSVLMKEMSFEVRQGDIFIIMGGSGSGKSTLMKVMVGLKSPASGSVHYGKTDFWALGAEGRKSMMRQFGILYQSGALWSSMTLAENVALPIEQYTDLNPRQVRELVSLKLALVGLSGFEDYYPQAISGGMRKRAGLARAMALDPKILFFDEPGAGLDPVSSKMLDDLILEIRDNLGSTIVIVTHELASIFAIGTRAIFLDMETRTIGAVGAPGELARQSDNPNVRQFLNRGETNGR